MNRPLVRIIVYAVDGDDEALTVDVTTGHEVDGVTADQVIAVLETLLTNGLGPKIDATWQAARQMTDADPGVVVVADCRLIFTIDRRNECRLRYAPGSTLTPQMAAELLAEAAARVLEATERG